MSTNSITLVPRMSASAAESKESEPRLVDNISCHSWNGDRSKMAICPGNNLLMIYSIKNGDPSQRTLEATLEEHDSYISAMDWCPLTNQIVTCSHDRNAYVWKQDAKGEWKPTLVVLRINRAATAVKWSPDGKKFAVASGAKSVPVCFYEAANDWWISRMIKDHKSTVLCLDWCPNSKMIVTGGTDKRCRIFSAFVDTVDNQEDAEVFAGIFPNQYEFGEVLHEFDFNQAWINSVAWSPGYFRIAFAAHNSTISFAQILGGGQPPVLQTLRVEGLPYTSLTFLSDNSVVTAGWDYNPHVYVASGADHAPAWALADKLDKKKAAGAAGGAAQEKRGSVFSAARTMFQSATSQGIAIKDNASQGSGPVTLETRHQNTIVGIFPFANADGSPSTKFTTCGTDGRVLMWDLKSLDVNLAALKLTA